MEDMTRAVPNEVAVGGRSLEAVEAEIRALTVDLQYHMRATVYTAVEIGRRLTEAKDLAKHGEWMNFLRRTGFSYSKANDLMKVFQAYGNQQKSLFGPELRPELTAANSQTYVNLSYSKALALLAIENEDDRAAFVKEHEGEIEDMSTRDLQEAVRIAEAAARARQAEEDRREIATVAAEREAALERVDALRKQVKELEARPIEVRGFDEAEEARVREEVQAEAERRWTEEQEKLRATLEKEKAEAVEATAKALNRAGDAERRAAEAEKKLAKAEKELSKAGKAAEEKAGQAGEETEKARAAEEKAAADAREARAAADQARREAEEAKAEAERLRKEAAMSGAPVARFRVAFALWQRAHDMAEDARRRMAQAEGDMLATLDQVEGETGDKLRQAVEAQRKAWREPAEEASD